MSLCENTDLALEIPGDFRRDALRLAAWLAVIIMIVWSPYIFAGRTLLASADVQSIYPTGAVAGTNPTRVLRSLDLGAPAWQNEPWLALQHRLVFGEHVLPMWDPYDAYGTPFAASMQGAPFYPLYFAVALHPSPLTDNVIVIGRLFIVGLGCGLFIRLFTGFTPALVAAICGVFSGYFLLYMNIGHIAVDAMLPWTLFGVELTARRPSLGSAAVLASAWALTLLGGMPESAALAGVVVASYAAFRIVISRATGAVLHRSAVMFAAMAVGSMIAGIMVVPFIEFAQRDFDIHQNRAVLAGLQHDIFRPRLLLTYFSALALGPPWNFILDGFSGHSGVRGAPGVFGIYCAVVAAVSAVLSYRRRTLAGRVVLFMTVVVAVLVAKRFGFPLVNWIGALPVLQLIQFSKYEEAIIAVLCACLAGFGAAAILERTASARAVIVSSVLVLGAITWLHANVVVPESASHAKLYYLAIGFMLAIFAATVSTSLWAVRRLGHGRSVSAIFIALALIEGTCAFFVPVYYIFDKPAAGSSNPYKGAPYVQFLQRATQRDGERIIALNGELFPDWASAFGLFDTRDVNAMYPRRYLPFVDAFLYPNSANAQDGIDRFTGRTTINFGSALAERWMALSSIGYVISNHPVLAAENPVLNALWAQTAPTVTPANEPAVHLSSIDVGGTSELTLFEHPPYNEVAYTSTIARPHPWFVVDLALDPAVWTQCGGAVTFQLDASNAAGASVGSAARTIDPKHNLADRRFTRLTLDLRKQAGQVITLRFATSTPVPGNTCAAWAHWGEPRWAPTEDLGPFREPSGSNVTLVRDVRDAYVYRSNGALPRLALFHHIEAAASGDQALRMLTSPGFDVRRTAVVEGDAPRLSGDGRDDYVRVLSRTSQRIEADVSTRADALLVQNDTWYPGWRATVDGQDSPIFAANYLFRGIVIPAGHHRVVIAYRSNAVAIGLALSLIGLLLLIGMCVVQVLQRRRARALVSPVNERPERPVAEMVEVMRHKDRP